MRPQDFIKPQDFKRVFSVQRMAKLIDEFGAIGADPLGGVTRLAFSEEDLRAREKIKYIMTEELSLEASVDPWGNIIGRRSGQLKGAPALITGSHLDSVQNGGKFDGPAGVLGAVEAFRALDSFGIKTDHPLELIVFTAEEPSPFGLSTIGSRGMAGKLKKEHLLGKKNDKGEELLDAIARIGGDPDHLEMGVRGSDKIYAFIEIHIEQMPYLEKERKDIGVVQGIAGIHRLRVTILGEAGHAGTTPMRERKDALVASAHLIRELNSLARSEKEKTVATIGQLSLQPNSVNIVPGKAVLEIEIRSFQLDSISRIKRGLDRALVDVEAEMGVKVIQEITYDLHPNTFSPRIREYLHGACRHLGFSSMDLVSMAGHDANHISNITDSGMIFVPSHKGLSHCPEEWTEPKHLVNGAQVLLRALLQLDQNT